MTRNDKGERPATGLAPGKSIAVAAHPTATLDAAPLGSRRGALSATRADTGVSPRFSAAFDLATRHYGCTPTEVAEIRAIAAADSVNAELCFALLAEEIYPERGINRRIRERIQREKAAG